ncbi:MAG: 16S rRNA (guanine(966)-N(2))-methyltransferase RsmD [Clostridia bacterium]
MRVISGTARGTKIDSIESMTTRPTLDRVKEALFSKLQMQIPDAQILDLFAGSGALGIECLSRGATHCVFCDKSYEASKMIIRNLEKTRMQEQSTLLTKDYKKCIELLKQSQFDIIFIDPPYRLDVAVDAIKRIVENQLLTKEGIIILETDDEKRELQELEKIQDVKMRLEVEDVRKYGRVKLIFLHERG